MFRENYKWWSIVSGVGMLVIILGYIYSVAKTETEPTNAAVETIQTCPHNPFATTTITAQSAYVYDIQKSEVLYSKNGSLTLPLASITKLMTVLVAYELKDVLPTITINQTALDIEGDHGLILGERWELIDLIKFIMVTSSNDGSEAIALNYDSTVGNKGSFIQKMKEKSSLLKMPSFIFRNPTGLDISSTTVSNEGSARDVALLAAHIYEQYPEIFEYTQSKRGSVRSLDYNHIIENTNQAVDIVPNVLGSKTGFTDLAGGNLALIVDLDFGSPVVVVILGSTRDERVLDAEILINNTRDYRQLECGKKNISYN